jgi:Icc-related predicted phosphoesterase
MAVRTLIAAGELLGNVARLGDLLEVAEEVGADAVTLVGDLTRPGPSQAEWFREVFRPLGRHPAHAYWVPGPGDAPLPVYLKESHSIEVVHPSVRGVHGTFAFAPGYVVVAGMGGEIVDDPDTEREEKTRLRYPGWEAAYRLKVLTELKDYPKVLLFSTPPSHKGLGKAGSDEVAELIKTLRPQVAVVAGGDKPETWMLADTLVVSPGSLNEGHYAVVDLTAKAAEGRTL